MLCFAGAGVAGVLEILWFIRSSECSGLSGARDARALRMVCFYGSRECSGLLGAGHAVVCLQQRSFLSPFLSSP